MGNDKDNLKFVFFKRRIVLIKGMYVALTAILILRLFKLQILDGLFFKKKANRNALRENFLIPNRGIIFDRNRKPLATTVIGYKILYYVGKTSNINEISKIYDILGRKKYQSASFLKSISRRLKRGQNQKIVLAKNLTSSEFTRLKFNNVYLPNMAIETYGKRRYPFKNNTSAIIGYVMTANNGVDDKIGKSNADYKVGFDGIEKILEYKIGGKVGVKYDVVNSVGKKVNEIAVTDAVHGKNINISIDQDLQGKLAQLMEGKNGAATLLDVKTGAVLAMVSSPNVDPNIMSSGISGEQWDEIMQQTKQNSGLFLNKNLSATYPPGSTFKIVSAITGLMNGLDPDEKYKCTGKHKIANRVFHCWKAKEGGHGWVNLETAIAQSCNCYFYNLSQKISNKDIYNTATLLGLGKKHMFDFNNELSGLVGNAKWLKKKHHQLWMPGDNANLVLGQGWTNLTPIQLAVMIARVATNKNIEPRYLLDDEEEDFASLGLPEIYLQYVRQGLFSVLNANYGIAYGLVSKKYQICGKTGSSQVVSQRIDNADMRANKVSIEKHSHALFVGYAPFDNPRYAVSVVVEHGIGGARGAAPIGTAILTEALKQETQYT